MRRQLLGGICVLLLIGALLGWHYNAKASREFELATDKFRAESTSELQQTQWRVNRALDQIYQNIRTIAALPSVRSLNRDAPELSDDARTSIQQIYNNLKSSVDVSEVYITRKDFDPEAVDPTTGKPQMVPLMFDELITDQSRTASTAEEDRAEHEDEELEEYEYRQLVEHIKRLRDHVPAGKELAQFSVPVISGPEITICDNTIYGTTRRESDRKGIMLSVPFYDKAGAIGGVVTAIISLLAVGNG